MDKTEVLRKYFGYSAFRAGQEQAVDAILRGQDVLCVMPTGAGKSLCYQVPGLVLDGVTLVVSPLISLMKDQVNALTQNGVRGAYLNSSLTAAQYAKALANVAAGMYKIIYVAPERLAVPEFVEACRGIRVSLLAVDEAHCISQWGQDFRPGYLKIAEFAAALGYRPTIAAFTATATREVKEDIERSLGLREPFRLTTGFDRPNLRFEVRRPKSKFDALLDVVERHAGDAGIVYCSTRKTVEEVCARLNEAGFSAAMYHAGLADRVRRESQEDFVYDRKSIMVATNAFGMGIDKSNVSYVVHYNMPKDVESYYQEAGRAGRDGSGAECVLLYSPGDVRTNQFLIEKSEPNPALTSEQQEALKAREHDRLKRMTRYATGMNCLRGYILRYFGETAPERCGNCSNCLAQFRETDVTVEAQKILSCVKRTGERFGKKMICDILKGSRNEKLLRLGLNGQTTYGLMKGCKTSRLNELIDLLEAEGYLLFVGNEFPVLTATPKANDVLFGGSSVMLRQAEEKTAERRRDTGDGGLLDVLKALRRKIADEKRVPAYVVFPDATLSDMCKKLPKTREALLAVSGVGKTKLEQYGERFLNAIRDYEIGAGETPREKTSFDLSAGQVKAFAYSKEPITATEIFERIAAIAPQEGGQRFPKKNLVKWLMSLDLIEEETLFNGTTLRKPTELGAAMGLLLEKRQGQKGFYYVLLYSLDAQHFVMDNIWAVLSFEPRESAASPRRGRAWSVKEERTLAELLRKGAPLTEMAKTLKRSEGGVCARLKRLGLIEDRSDLS
ncbi:MAG: DNA helicase RecQ [Clostridia bacterium]|nr:DNA helicase RecQ [Clostridia bacterium]